MRLLTLLSFALLLRVDAASAQLVTGKIIDQISETGVVAADVQLLDRAGAVVVRTVSDSAGNFRMIAPLPGVYLVRAVSLGYSTLQTRELELERARELQVELRLAASGIPHEPLRVIAQRQYRIGRLAEYYDRADWARRSGFGKIFTRDQIEAQRAQNVLQFVRQVPTRAGCRFNYLIDGLHLSEAEADQTIRPNELEGIEIYKSPNVPMQYEKYGDCVVLMWTRMDSNEMRPFSWKRVFAAAGLGFVLFVLIR